MWRRRKSRQKACSEKKQAREMLRRAQDGLQEAAARSVEVDRLASELRRALGVQR